MDVLLRANGNYLHHEHSERIPDEATLCPYHLLNSDRGCGRCFVKDYDDQQADPRSIAKASKERKHTPTQHQFKLNEELQEHLQKILQSTRNAECTSVSQRISAAEENRAWVASTSNRIPSPVMHLAPPLPAPGTPISTSAWPGPNDTPRYHVTELIFLQANMIATASCYANAAMVNSANPILAGGGFTKGNPSPEEELCHHIPHLHSQLCRSEYPLGNEAIINDRLPGGLWPNGVRGEEVDEFCIISAALGKRSLLPVAPTTEDWKQDTQRTLRSVFTAAQNHGKTTLVLGAFGCEDHHNPAADVAQELANVLLNDEFQGAFRRIVIAINDDENTNYLRTFKHTLQQLLPRKETPANDMDDNRHLNTNSASRQNRASPTHSASSRSASNGKRHTYTPGAGRDTHFPRTDASYHQEQGLPSSWSEHHETTPQSNWQQGWNAHDDMAGPGWHHHGHARSTGATSSSALRWDTREMRSYESWHAQPMGEKHAPQNKRGQEDNESWRIEAFDTDIQIGLANRPSHGHTDEHT